MLHTLEMTPGGEITYIVSTRDRFPQIWLNDMCTDEPLNI